ncbi:peptidase M4 [Streptomyces sp. A1277]|uniref:PepSY domain-containing protein n=1 Tax=Streptomyces sp. A1277 TaxID=2563103 RepID=UPI0010A25AAF|nr:PepSY domain-containing protein [Streptomyces sp. A1277]THA34497.1 peptidase M4 [Streptomyces sp. A1277]
MTNDLHPKNTGFLRSHRLRAAGAAGVLLAAALLTGCGQDSGSTSTAAETSEAARAVPEATGSPSPSASKSASPAQMTEDQKERKELISATKVTYDKAITTAEGAVKGSKLTELELKGPGDADDDESASPSPTGSPSPSGSATPGAGPQWVAAVVAKDGTKHIVRIDAVSGKVVKSSEDSDQDAEDKTKMVKRIAEAKQTPQQAAKAALAKKKGTVTSIDLDENDKDVLVWKTDVVTKDWNKTTFDIDADNGSVTHEETDRD